MPLIRRIRVVNIIIFLPKANKGVEWIWVPEIMTDDWVRKGQAKLNLFSVFGEEINQREKNFGSRVALLPRKFFPLLESFPKSPQKVLAIKKNETK